ncbi:MAG TPA: hypothetical protein PLN54_00145 [Flavobacteriales bacterium]|nr:hypothetical protein [Flavobacteriales bacterium]
MIQPLVLVLKRSRQWLFSAEAVWFPFLLVFLFFAQASIEFNDRIGLDDWRSDLRADAGGYYIYLPGTFHHGMRASAVSDSTVWKGGNGFQVDREKDRIITKYTYGTALLQLPFYLFAEAVEGFGATDGWSRSHHRAIEVAGIFYWSAGLLLFLLAMRRWWPCTPGVALVTLAAVAFGTNSFYYAFRNPGYSHVYSFFLVALALYALYVDRGGSMRNRSLWLFQASCALILVVRPIDGLAVAALYALLSIERPEVFLAWRTHLVQVVIALVFALPQLIYWKYVHGAWLVYSYGEERFTNLATPLFDLVLLSPLNGLLPHAPAFFLLGPALIFLFTQRWRVALVFLIMFTLLIYSFAAWHAWHFGCGYGMRPAIEYTPFLGMTIWTLLDGLRRRSPALYHGLVPLLVIICFVNYRAMLQYGGCYVGEQWEWTPYARNILEAFFGKITL